MSVHEPHDDERPHCSDGGVDCSQALHDLQRYLDGELPEGELSTIKEHLAACYPCADRATFEEQLRALVRDRCAEAAPPQLVEQIRDRLDRVRLD
jgi:anti-sigma factor (TIGR02949 family)